MRTVAALVRFGLLAWRRHRPLLCGADLLVAHDIYLLPLGVALSRRLGIPLAYDAHEDFAVMEAGRLPSGVLRVAAAVETLLARHAELVVVPGRVRQRRWTDAGFSRPVVLANSGVAMSHERSNDADGENVWDVVYCGLLDPTRRPDLLVELARQRPDLRIAVAGDGRAVASVREAAAKLENLEFLGWADDPDAILERSRAVYYGLDPRNAYAEAACPNNLYQAIRACRPLVFFCGGEVAEMARRFRIGLRVPATVQSLAEALDVIRSDKQEWDFDTAAQAVKVDTGRDYVDAIAATLML
jgi:glycosyltransferase involved in cell wall biosynthesis